MSERLTPRQDADTCEWFEVVDHVPKLPRRACGTTRRLIQEFLRSGASAVRLNEDFPTSRACKVRRTSIYVTIQRHGFPVKVLQRNCRVYLVRMEEVPNADA